MAAAILTAAARWLHSHRKTGDILTSRVLFLEHGKPFGFSTLSSNSTARKSQLPRGQKRLEKANA
ncbi:MAG: hypothetical protein AB7M93_29875, partial [Candidatus Obscuribacterales bacterium]